VARASKKGGKGAKKRGKAGEEMHIQGPVKSSRNLKRETKRTKRAPVGETQEETDGKGRLFKMKRCPIGGGYAEKVKYSRKKNVEAGVTSGKLGTSF